MSSNTFWVVIWSIVGFVISTLILSILSYNMSLDSKKLELAKAGFSPELVPCVFDSSHGRKEAVCILHAVKQEQRNDSSKTENP